MAELAEMRDDLLEIVASDVVRRNADWTALADALGAFKKAREEAAAFAEMKRKAEQANPLGSPKKSCPHCGPIPC